MTPTPMTPEEEATAIAFGLVWDEGGSLAERQELARAIAAALRARASSYAKASEDKAPVSTDVAGVVEKLVTYANGSLALDDRGTVVRAAAALLLKLDARVNEERLAFSATERDMNRTALAHLNRATAAESRLRLAEEVVRAAQYFDAGGAWGTRLAMITNGAASRVEGLEHCKEIVRAQRKLSDALNQWKTGRLDE